MPATVMSELPRPDGGLLVLDERVDALVLRKTRGRFSATSFLGLVAASPRLSQYLAGVVLTESLLMSLRGQQGLTERLAIGVCLRPTDRAREESIETALVRVEQGRHRSPIKFVEWHATPSMFTGQDRPAELTARYLARAAQATQARGLVPQLCVTAGLRRARDVALDHVNEHGLILALGDELAARSVDPRKLMVRYTISHPQRRGLDSRAVEDAATRAFEAVEDLSASGLSSAYFTSANGGLLHLCRDLTQIQEQRRVRGSLWTASFASGPGLLAGVLDDWDGNLRSQITQARLTNNLRAATAAVLGEPMGRGVVRGSRTRKGPLSGKVPGQRPFSQVVAGRVSGFTT